MKRLLCPEIPRPGHPTTLPEAEANHATQVLRLGNGAIVQVMDGKGHAAQARLKFADRGVLLEYVGEIEGVGAQGQVIPVVLELALLKGDAMEWAIEKAVELGARELVPVITDHCVVQVDRKGPKAYQERWQKIADQSLKQCGRLERMAVHEPIALQDRLTLTSGSVPQDRRFWLDEGAREKSPSLWERTTRLAKDSARIVLLVGPEGGWSEKERAMLASSAVPASLGPLVLRAETAAISSLAILSAWARG